MAAPFSDPHARRFLRTGVHFPRLWYGRRCSPSPVDCFREGGGWCGSERGKTWGSRGSQFVPHSRITAPSGGSSGTIELPSGARARVKVNLAVNPSRRWTCAKKARTTRTWSQCKKPTPGELLSAMGTHSTGPRVAVESVLTGLRTQTRVTPLADTPTWSHPGCQVTCRVMRSEISSHLKCPLLPQEHAGPNAGTMWGRTPWDEPLSISLQGTSAILWDRTVVQDSGVA